MRRLLVELLAAALVLRLLNRHSALDVPLREAPGDAPVDEAEINLLTAGVTGSIGDWY